MHGEGYADELAYLTAELCGPQGKSPRKSGPFVGESDISQSVVKNCGFRLDRNTG